jgi:hypothetical protein
MKFKKKLTMNSVLIKDITFHYDMAYKTTKPNIVSHTRCQTNKQTNKQTKVLMRPWTLLWITIHLHQIMTAIVLLPWFRHIPYQESHQR